MQIIRLFQPLFNRHKFKEILFSVFTDQQYTTNRALEDSTISRSVGDR